jgi:hypothetical protein
MTLCSVCHVAQAHDPRVVQLDCCGFAHIGCLVGWVVDDGNRVCPHCHSASRPFGHCGGVLSDKLIKYVLNTNEARIARLIAVLSAASKAPSASMPVRRCA